MLNLKRWLHEDKYFGSNSSTRWFERNSKKNIYPIGGYPLISYTIAAAKSKFITDLVVSTDSEEIAEVSRSYGADVPFKRPKKLAGDKVFSC